MFCPVAGCTLESKLELTDRGPASVGGPLLVDYFSFWQITFSPGRLFFLLAYYSATHSHGSLCQSKYVLDQVSSSIFKYGEAKELLTISQRSEKVHKLAKVWLVPT